MRRLSLQLSVGLSAVALLTAACSSSSTSSTSSTAPAAASTSSTATGQAAGNAIVVGGLQDGNFPGMDTGFEARIARFNSQGGIDGRKIKFLGVLNDGDSLTTDLNNAQTLVLKDHVFAVAPIADEVLNPASVQLFAQNSTPYIGWGISPAWCGNNWGFPLTGCEASTQYQNIGGLAQAAQTRSILDVADQVILLELGRILWTGPRGDLQEDQLAAIYLGSARHAVAATAKMAGAEGARPGDPQPAEDQAPSPSS
jgi:hypothetical protein